MIIWLVGKQLEMQIDLKYKYMYIFQCVDLTIFLNSKIFRYQSIGFYIEHVLTITGILI